MRGFVQNRMLCSAALVSPSWIQNRQAGLQRVGEFRARRRRETASPVVDDFKRFPIIGVTDNFGFGPQPIGKTLALWTAFCLSDRKGSLPNNGLLSPIPGHHALEHTNRGLSPAPHPHSDV